MTPAGGELPAGGMPLRDRILAVRGITGGDAIRTFCDPRLSSMHDPDLLPGAPEAAVRIAEGLAAGERIVIWGDYDVDGVTASSILVHVIRAIQPDADLHVFTPHRLRDGYGLNAASVGRLADEGTQLIVTVDCGVTAVEEVALARERGMDLIVSDHHEPPDVLPDAIIVHPAIPGSAYPFPDLCGAGVAYKLAWRLAVEVCGSRRLPAAVRDVLLDQLPLVALGTIADVVPLVGENRVLAANGLKLMPASRNAGLHALMKAARVDPHDVEASDVGYRIGPRINACGRLDDAARAVHLLTDADAAEADDIASAMTKLNDERRATEQRIVEEAAQAAIDAGMTGDGTRAIVLAGEGWHRGVVGIVCSRLVERFGRPVILLEDGDDEWLRGSARSIDEYSIHAGLAACSSLLERWGGHEMAGGMTLHRDNLEAFRAAIQQHAFDAIPAESLCPLITIDCDARLDELNVASVQHVRALAPFGRSNRTPTIRLKDVEIAATPNRMGGEGRHLEVKFRAEGHRGVLRAVWWRQGELAGELAAGMRVDVAIEPKIDRYAGRVRVQGTIRDIRKH